MRLEQVKVTLGVDAPANATCSCCGNIVKDKQFPGNPPSLQQFAKRIDKDRLEQCEGYFCNRACYDNYQRSAT